MTTPHNTTLALVALLLLVLLCSCGSTPATTIEVNLTVGGDVRGGPTLTASFIDQELAVAGSPAANKGLGAALTQLSKQYQIDNAYALAFFHHESSYGTRGVARFTHSLGNIRCTPGWSCKEGYRSYSSWQDGAADWFQLISTVYLPDGRTTVATIIPKYAPQADNNNENAYINSVLADVSRYRSL